MKFLPNALTIARILLTPLVLWFLWSGGLSGQIWALALFVLAAVSDYLDGRLARSYGAGSRLGQFLDPLADKVLVIGTFVVLAITLPNVVPWWAVWIIAVRDVATTFLRSWAESRGRSVKTLGAARIKTAFQLTFLIGMLVVLVATKIPGVIGDAANWFVESEIPFVLLILVVAVTVITGAMYFLPRASSQASPDDESDLP